MIWLLGTMLLGSVFLGVKVVEYADKFKHDLVPGPNFHFDNPVYQQTAQIYYSLYFAMTGSTPLHMIVGHRHPGGAHPQGARRASSTPEATRRSRVMGLYWHFVDLVWIFLFPLLYLIGGH